MSQYVYNKHNTTWKALCTVFTHSLFLYQKGCLENDELENNDLENDDLENDDKDGVARRIKGLEGYRRREIRGR